SPLPFTPSLHDALPISALRGLTALFGMGRGVSLSQSPPQICERPPSRAAPENCTDSHFGYRRKNIRQALDPLVPVSFTHRCASRSEEHTSELQSRFDLV